MKKTLYIISALVLTTMHAGVIKIRNGTGHDVEGTITYTVNELCSNEDFAIKDTATKTINWGGCCMKGIRFSVADTNFDNITFESSDKWKNNGNYGHIDLGITGVWCVSGKGNYVLSIKNNNLVLNKE